MGDLTLSRLIRTLKNTFGIGRLTIDASALTAGRVIHAPDKDVRLGDMEGEIRHYAGSDSPASGWLPCEGQLLAVADYPLLFAVIGATYGGDGVNDFALPNHRRPGAGVRRIICVDYHAIQPVLQVTVPSAIVGPVNGIYWASDVLLFLVPLIESVTVTGGPPKLSVTIGANSYLLSQTAATATLWEYEHVVQSGDYGEITAAIDLNGATLTVATVPAVLDNHYVSGAVLGMQLGGAEAGITPVADTGVITQIHQLSGDEATMIPTAETNAITLS